VGEPCLREERKATDGFLAIKRSHIMSSYQDYQDEITKDSKTVQKKIAETEKKIGDTTLQVQDEFFKTCDEMGRAVVSRATAQIELTSKLTEKLRAAHSLPDVVSAYQEWLSEQMNACSEDTRQFMTNSQKFMTTSTRLFSNGWSGVGMSR
jgi:Phasin protein